MRDVTTEATNRRELCCRLLAAADTGSAATTPLHGGTGTSQIVRDSGEAYVLKRLPGSPVALLKARLSAWKHSVIDGDPACPPASPRERIERFHEAVHVWTKYGFEHNVPALVSRPEDDFIIYRYVEGLLLRQAMGSDWGTRPADMAPVMLALAHMRERHRAALGCPEADEARSLLHQDPHILNIVISGDVPVFVDLDDPLSSGVPLRELIGRELAIFGYRVLRLMPREQIPSALDQMMRCYVSSDTWEVAAEFLGRRRRVELLSLGRRRQHSISKLALSEAIRARLS